MNQIRTDQYDDFVKMNQQKVKDDLESNNGKSVKNDAYDRLE